MITECMIFLASFALPQDTNIKETPNTIDNIASCTRLIPNSMIEHIPYYVEHFDEDNLYKAMRIGWCESRGEETAYRKSSDDSGIMQFIPSTWNWVAEKFDIPLFDSEILTYDGIPIKILPKQPHYNKELFKYEKIQFVAYYNILMASHLAEDTYSKTKFKDWNASKWCWGNIKYFEKRWRKEGF